MAFLNPFRQHKKNHLAAVRQAIGLEFSNHFSNKPIVAPGGPVVCLTSWGQRIDSVHSTIESIGRGALRPSRLLLWLGEKDATRRVSSALRRLEARGLELRYVRDEGPHTKYYPYVAGETAFDRPLVTADDDIFYPQDWLQGLVRAHKTRPEVIHAYRAKRVLLRDGVLTPSRQWGMCMTTEPHACNLATGVSGVIYPITFLRHLKQAGTGFRELSPRDDDLWLHLQALRSGHRVAQIAPRAVHFVGRLGTQREALYRYNIRQGGTDNVVPKLYGPADLLMLRKSEGAH